MAEQQNAQNVNPQNVQQEGQQRKTHWTDADIAALEACYPCSTVRPTYEKVLEHEEFTYLWSLLVYRENTEYFPTTDEQDDEIHIVSSQVMVELTLQDKVMAVMLESDNDDSTERILCPLTVQDVYEAEKAVKNYASNAGIIALFIKFPYQPMQHNLPVVQLVERELDFHKWEPELPTQENWRVFLYAPTNIRYLGITYAANCRHKLGHWDEHPWCAACLLKAKIKPCIHPDVRRDGDEYCYICSTMSPEAISAFLKKFETWAEKQDEDDGLTPKGRKLPTKIRCQIHADLASASSAPDINPGWDKKFYGICRPALAMPLYATWEDYSKWSPQDRKTACKSHLKAFRQRYEKDRENQKKEDLVHWPDLVQFDLMAGKKTRKAQQTQEEQDSNDDQDGDGDANAARKASAKPTSGRASPRKKTKRTVRKPETETQRQNRLRAQRDKEKQRKDRELREKREMKNEIKALKEQVKTLEQDLAQRTAPKQRNQWKSRDFQCTVPEGDISASYDFNSAIKAAARMSKNVSWVETEEPAEKRRKVVHKSIFKQKQGYFAPNQLIMQKIDETLAQYAEDTECPTLEENLPVCLTDFVNSAILPTPPKSEGDVNRCFPTDRDEVLVHQFEAMRLDSLNGAMVKVHEVESACFSALMDNVDPARLTGPEVPDDMIVLDAAAYCHTVRESMLAESTAIVIAARRRDNAMRQNVPEHHCTNIIAHPIQPKEKALIMREKETVQGRGSRQSRV